MCSGGEEEAEAAYDEAFHAIFHLQLQRHRHTQPYISKKDGKSKWVMIEMSPITVSAQTCLIWHPSHVSWLEIAVCVVTFAKSGSAPDVAVCMT